MCGRYYLDNEINEMELQKIINQIKHKYFNSPELAEMKTGEIFPTEIAPVITAEEPALMKWGFTSYDKKHHIINARLETAKEKPTFRNLFLTQRCLIPASYYFEWSKHTPIKQKYAIGEKEPIYMAGLYRWEEKLSLPVFVILTRQAADNLAFIHDRMPLILARDTHQSWLDKSADLREIQEINPTQLTYQIV